MLKWLATQQVAVSKFRVSQQWEVLCSGESLVNSSGRCTDMRTKHTSLPMRLVLVRMHVSKPTWRKSVSFIGWPCAARANEMMSS